MRNKLLAMHGWEVVSIPFNEWARLAGLQEKQARLAVVHQAWQWPRRPPMHAATAAVLPSACYSCLLLTPCLQRWSIPRYRIT